MSTGEHHVHGRHRIDEPPLVASSMLLAGCERPLSHSCARLNWLGAADLCKENRNHHPPTVPLLLIKYFLKTRHLVVPVQRPPHLVSQWLGLQKNITEQRTAEQTHPPCIAKVLGVLPVQQLGTSGAQRCLANLRILLAAGSPRGENNPL